MKSIVSSRKGTVLVVIVAALLLPRAAHAGLGDILSLFRAITGTVSNMIGPALAGIQTTELRIRAMEQQVVWPQTLIEQARSSVQRLRAEFSTAAERIPARAVASATLPAPNQLERLLRGSDVRELERIEDSYRNVFQPLPAPQSATPAQRSLIDMDDAAALAALKAATASDAAGADQLTLADNLERQTAGAAPGSAPLLAAQAEIAQLESQAMLQRLLAAQLRQEAALLAHDNALRKQRAAALEQFRGNMLRLLDRH